MNGNTPDLHPLTPGRPDRRLTLAALVPALGLFLPLFVPLLTGRVFTGDDLSAFHLPMRHLYSAALGEGHSILWTPYLFDGFYIHAEGQVGALHPLHLALYALLPLAAAFNIEFVASYAAAFAGMWLFLARTGLGTPASIVGAMAFAFSGFLLLHHIHMNAIAIAAHIPWLLAALDSLLSPAGKPRVLAFVAIPVLVGSQVLLGYPQYVWMSALVCVVYGVVQVRRSAWPRLLAAAGAAGLGLLVGGAQLLPTLDLLDESLRSNESREFALTFSLHPLNMLQLVSPYVFAERVHAIPPERIMHESGVYSSAFCTIALLYIVIRWRELAFRQLAASGLALCAVGLFLALGRYGFVYEYVAAVPVLGAFRAPARHLLLLHIGLSVLAAITFDDLVRLVKSRRGQGGASWAIFASVVLSVITAGIAVAFPAPFETGPSPPLALRALLGIALTGSAALLVKAAMNGNRIALMGLPLYLALDLGSWGYSYVWKSPPRAIPALAANVALPEDVRPGETLHLNLPDARRNLVLLRGFKLFVPYVGLAPSRTLPVQHDETLRIGGVSWAWNAGRLQQVTAPMPRARLVFDAVASDDPARDLSKIDVSSTALVPPGLPPLRERGSGAAKIVLDQPGRLEIDISTSARALLVTTESYHAGWSAAVHTTQTSTARVYGDYLGVVLEPGEYRLSLRFSPASWRHGLWLSLAGLLVTLSIAGGWAVSARSFRRRVSD